MTASESECSELGELRAQLDAQRGRITELEIEAAFRRQTIDDLDEVIRDQALRVDALERRLTELLNMVESPASD